MSLPRSMLMPQVNSKLPAVSDASRGMLAGAALQTVRQRKQPGFANPRQNSQPHGLKLPGLLTHDAVKGQRGRPDREHPRSA